MDNLDVWNRVSTVDVTQTKQAKVDGNNVTAISGTYMIKKATQEWGILGVGWGYEIVEERLDDSGPIYDAKQEDVLCTGKLHTILVKVWFMNGDAKSETSAHYGHTKYIYKSKFGFTVDYDYAKKSLTDAIKKCLSMYGFCSDVYMGKFDNPEFRENSQHILAIENAENQADEILNKKGELLKYVEQSIKGFSMVPSIPALTLVVEKNINSVVSQCNAIRMDAEKIEKMVKQLKDACKSRMEEIKEKQK